MFRICYTDTMQGSAIAQFACKNGIGTAAILTEASSDYSRGMSQVFAKTFTSLGGTVTTQEYYASGETDFCTVLTKLKQQPFDALFLPGYYTEASLVIRQMHDLGLQAVILSGDAFDVPALNELVGSSEYLSNIYFTDHYAPTGIEHSAFARQYYDTYGEEAPAYAALGYDCAKLFALAVQKTEGQTPAEIYGQLARTADYSGVTGLITIDENHNAQKPGHIISMQNGVRTEAAVVNTK
jgi:branched-chain amino acid transport system substrate-binding protein